MRNAFLMMKGMHAILFWLALCLGLHAKDVLVADFGRQDGFRLFDGAQLKDGRLTLRGSKSHAEVVGSERFKVGRGGLTISCIAAFDKLPALGQDLFWKKDSWMLSRFDSGAMTAYLHNGSNFTARTNGGGAAAEPGVFNHYALTIRRFVQTEEGKYGYIVEIFINGELEARTENFDLKLNEPDEPVQLGRGAAGDVWAMNGQIAFFRMEDRVLSQEELYEEAKKSGLVKMKPSRFKEIGEPLKAALESLPQALPERQWLVGAFRRAAVNGANQGTLAAALGKLQGISAKTLEEAAERINAEQEMFRLLVGSRAALCYVVKDSGSAFPLCGMYDRKSGREIFGRQTMDFRLKTAIGKKRSGYTATESPWQKEVAVSGNQVTMVFRNAAALVTLTQVFDGIARLESHMDVKMTDQRQLLQEVVFPQTVFARLDRGVDKMVYPWQEGVIVEEPTVKNHSRVRQNMFYPRSYLSMQFGAYYDDASGVYFAFEDPDAEVKQYYAQGQRGELVAMWTGFAAWPPGCVGGNGYNMSGVSAIELYDGEWFEATKVYRRFLEGKAKWWVKEVPRKDTAKRFRDLPLWVQVQQSHMVYRKDPRILAEELKLFRDYLELPYGVHFYGWDDRRKNDWPHFLPSDEFADTLKDIGERTDIYIKPYTDARLWAVKDGGYGKFDYMFTSHGKKYAVKNPDGSMNYENYRSYATKDPTMCAYAIMCPGAVGWQDTMVEMVTRVLGYGVPSVYLDEIAAARPYNCFDGGHGHLINDPKVWIAGHRKFMTEIRRRRPGAFFDCEDGAEAFLDMLDGMMIWRWHGVTPIFNAIYHGRIQFTGRHYSRPYGDLNAAHRQFFVKTAVQLVGAEQLGWFLMFHLQFPQRRLFIKKMSHVRNMLLEYFNEGEMLAPISYIRHPGTDKCNWTKMFGGNVQTDKVVSGIFQRKDGVAVAIFVNPYGESAEFEPDFRRYGKAVVAVLGENGRLAGARMTLAAESAAIVVLANHLDDAARKEADRIGEYMRRIGGFTAGASPDAVR
ncbi:MAG: LamG domain-containing protein [Victivallales bacterium]|nr:LamG domain-containing protein [Victivallales bacterium]